MAKEYAIYELLQRISKLINYLDDSLDWFIISRFTPNEDKKKLYQNIYEEKAIKSNLILQDAYDNRWMQLIKEILCNEQ